LSAITGLKNGVHWEIDEIMSQEAAQPREDKESVCHLNARVLEVVLFLRHHDDIMPVVSF